MKQQVVFIHGGDSFSKREDFLTYLKSVELRDPLTQSSEHWNKKLREELGAEYELYQPAMPNKQNADFEEWKIWFEKHLPFLNDGVILVGWSLGGMFLAKYLSENVLPMKVGQLYLLAAPCGEYTDPGDENSGNDCGTFKFPVHKLEHLAKQVEKIQIWHSKDDFVVPYSHALEFVRVMPTANLVTFSDRNHFLQADFPELVASIKGLI